MFNFLKKEKGTGALLDDRPMTQILKDYTFEETVSSVAPVNWIEKNEKDWRKFPIFNQDGSGSCVSQSLAKMLGVLYWLKNETYVHFSATHIYQRRRNRPNPGMIGIDAFDIAKRGVTLECLAPSQNMCDVQMDNVEIEKYKEEVGEVFKINNFVTLPVRDIDLIASTIQTTEKPIMVWFYFERNEWTDVPIIKNESLKANETGICRHSVTAVDYTLYDGEKALVVEDSWGPKHGIGGRRIITEDFFEKRNIFAAYATNFKFDTDIQAEKPKYTFNIDLKFSPVFIVEEEVKILQDILKFEKLFPLNIDSTGYYGAITCKAVLAFQRKYSVADEEELERLQGKIVGPKTRKVLNELYGR